MFLETENPLLVVLGQSAGWALLGASEDGLQAARRLAGKTIPAENGARVRPGAKAASRAALTASCSSHRPGMTILGSIQDGLEREFRDPGVIKSVLDGSAARPRFPARRWRPFSVLIILVWPGSGSACLAAQLTAPADRP